MLLIIKITQLCLRVILVGLSISVLGICLRGINGICKLSVWLANQQAHGISLPLIG